jgi:hypothetical protein
MAKSTSKSATTTFTMRMTQNDYDLLASLAAIFNMTIAELAREIMAEGIRDRLDPVAIDRRIEKERERLLEAANKIREKTEQAASHTAEPPTPAGESGPRSETRKASDREPVAQGANCASQTGSPDSGDPEPGV